MSAAGQSSGRAAIETRQLDQLRALLAEILPANRFYATKFAGSGVDSSVTSLADFCRLAPLTTKQELVDDQEANPPYGTNLTYPLERYTRFNQTSGTTGKPMRWLDTPENWNYLIDCWTRVYQAADTGPQDRVFFPFSFGPFLGFWVAFDAAVRLGCLAIPGGGMSSAARLRVILDNEITILCATPTYAIRLAEVAAQEGIDLTKSKVRRIIVAGEPGGSIPATRDHIERVWPGARVVDHHGMTEIGPASYECPERRGVLHIIEPGFYPEVINPETQVAVSPGGTGELVLTNLGRTGSPLLRYRTGDLVRRSAQTACECGSDEMALEGGILGRADDMVVVRGVNIFPSAVEEVLRACGGVGEYCVAVRSGDGLAEISLQIEPSAGTAEADLFPRVEAAMRDAFGLRVPVTAALAGSLPRFEAKAKRWVRH